MGTGVYCSFYGFSCKIIQGENPLLLCAVAASFFACFFG